MEQMSRTFVIFCAALLVSAPALAKKAVGTMMVVKGKVFIQAKGKKKKKARVGTKVKASDTVITNKNSRVKVVMIDKNIIHISPDSKMNFEKYVFDKSKGKKDVLLNVLYGKVRSNVKQKYDGKKNRYQVKTKAAVAGVRGTDFLSAYNPATNQANFVTFKGLVAVGKPGVGGAILNPVQVAPGQKTSAAVGSSTVNTPTKMSKQEYAQADTGSSGEPPRQPANEPGPEGPAGNEEGNKQEGPGGPEDGAQRGPEGEGPGGPNGPEGPGGPNGPEGGFAEGPDGEFKNEGREGPGGPNGPEGSFANEGGPDGPRGPGGPEGGFAEGPNGPGGFGPEGAGEPGGFAGPEGGRDPASTGGGFGPDFGAPGDMLGPPPPPTAGGPDFLPPDFGGGPLPFIPPNIDILPDLPYFENPCQINPEACGAGNTRLRIEVTQ